MYTKRITADTVEKIFKVVAWIAWLSPALYFFNIFHFIGTSRDYPGVWYVWLLLPMLLVHYSGYFLYDCIDGDYLADKINNLRLPKWDIEPFNKLQTCIAFGAMAAMFPFAYYTVVYNSLIAFCCVCAMPFIILISLSFTPKKKTAPKPTLDRQGLLMWLQYYALYPFIRRNANHKYIKAIPMHRADRYSLILFCAVLIIIIGVL